MRLLTRFGCIAVFGLIAVHVTAHAARAQVCVNGSCARPAGAFVPAPPASAYTASEPDVLEPVSYSAPRRYYVPAPSYVAAPFVTIRSYADPVPVVRYYRVRRPMFSRLFAGGVCQ